MATRVHNKNTKRLKKGSKKKSKGSKKKSSRKALTSRPKSAKSKTAPSRKARASTRKLSRAAKARSAKARPASGRPVRTPQAPGSLGLQSQHVDFMTYKVDQVRKFYGETLGFRAEQRESDLNYLVVETTASSSLGFMPPHPKMTGEQPPPREPTLYFIVKDVDRAYATLMAKGVAFMGPPQEMPWGHRVIITTDPEGRTVMLGSEPKKGKNK